MQSYKIYSYTKHPVTINFPSEQLKDVVKFLYEFSWLETESKLQSIALTERSNVVEITLESSLIQKKSAQEFKHSVLGLKSVESNLDKYWQVNDESKFDFMSTFKRTACCHLTVKPHKVDEIVGLLFDKFCDNSASHRTAWAEAYHKVKNRTVTKP